jgi:hypothetical protein
MVETARLPYVSEDGNVKFINHVHSNPCAEAPIAGDYSGSLTHEEWDVLAKQAAQDLEEQKLWWEAPPNMNQPLSYLKEMMESMCAAYSEKYGLFLDMTNPNLYTIYKSDGHFISLRDLYRDGVYPLDMNFKMIDGTPQDELDFEPFVDQAGKMVSCGR